MAERTVWLNAWLGPDVQPESRVASDEAVENWLTQLDLKPPRLPMYAEDHPGWRRWDDPRVGWGLLLAHRADLTNGQLAEPDPEPEWEPIRHLWQHRDRPPIYRFDPDNPGYLRRHDRQGIVSQQDLDKAQTGYGTGVGQVPFYLLICGSPRAVPWEIQFQLNLSRCVGRLDLPLDALQRYVAALVTQWADSTADPHQTVVWSTAHDWVTRVMKRAVAEPLGNHFRADPTPAIRTGTHYLEGDRATVAALRTALEASKPGLVVATSHGCMDADRAGLANRLGLHVDSRQELTRPETLLANWQPDGAIWFALACCSAGARSKNSYDGLLDRDTRSHATLERVARELGPTVAPLPQALLGAARPLRAFVGHVEPTFDRTWYDEDTQQKLADFLVGAFYDHLFQQQSEPIGLALREHFLQYGTLRDDASDWTSWRQFDPQAPRRMVDAALRALDVRNLVILGDPTVALDFARARPGARPAMGAPW